MSKIPPSSLSSLHPCFLTFDALGHMLMTQAFQTLQALMPTAPLKAIDATAGNGYDTLFLAQQLAPHGHVWAFDVQSAALEATRARLKNQSAPLADVSCINEGHEHMQALVAEPVHAVLFNLGYLPGSDKSLCTHVKTTMQAIEQAQSLLVCGGFLWIHAYTGQRGGEEECEALAAHMGQLAYEEWRVLHTVSPNKKLRQEHAFFVQKRRV